jgi:hypothetical protein
MNILVVGCSMTYGAGLEHSKLDKRLWSNKLFKDVFGKDVNITNGSKIGRNNHWIFLETMDYLAKNTYDLIVVAWSAIPRYEYHVDLEMYSTHTMLKDKSGINTNRFGTVSARWLTETGNRLRRIHNDHWDLLNLVKYTNILLNSTQGNKVLFVNTLMSLPTNYFNRKTISLPYELTAYEHEILNVDARSDGNIKEMYNMMHDQYSKYGGIQEDKWLNLYKSLSEMQIDDASDSDTHPGYASQDVFIKKFIPLLREKIKK